MMMMMMIGDVVVFTITNYLVPFWFVIFRITGKDFKYFLRVPGMKQIIIKIYIVMPMYYVADTLISLNL